MANQLRGLADDGETDFTEEAEDDMDAAEQKQNERILTALELLTAAITAQKALSVTVQQEKPRVTVANPKCWEFTIERNAAGQISKITADAK